MTGGDTEPFKEISCENPQGSSPATLAKQTLLSIPAYTVITEELLF